MVEAISDGVRPQVRLLAISAVLGAVLLGVSLVVSLAGLNDPESPKMPVLPTEIPTLPSKVPLFPSGPSGPPIRLPTNFPSDLATRMPTSVPSWPGGRP
ncbi:hypothetical protein [Actinoallomurus rhizosphaericola]|uniref:hypothetical protein n=1 Tax=Actinoallomurus rhizosphaericola TaxID=2952536 RepID=UPI002093F449|nr:hypothetical protein [Actinoallomurus rhizosphaericola]MCO5999265.1 hypothetical protein [Actinoallomurus rhizosphaericola]